MKLSNEQVEAVRKVARRQTFNGKATVEFSHCCDDHVAVAVFREPVMSPVDLHAVCNFSVGADFGRPFICRV